MTLPVPWGPEALSLIAGLLAARAIWWGLHPPAAVSFRGRRRTKPLQSLANKGLTREWLALTKIPLTPRGVQRLGWASAAAVALFVSSFTHNPLVGTAFGSMGLWMPELIIRYIARKRWRALDQSAYSATHMLRFALARGTPVLEAFRAIIPQSDPAFREWATPLLVLEAGESPLEESLKKAASAIKHVELSVLADILAAERSHGQTAPVVDRLVDLWGQRLRSDSVRRGTLAGGMMLGYGVIWIGIGVFWATVIGSPVARHGLHAGVGFWAMGIGAWLLAIAGAMQNRVTRQAEATA